MNHDLLLPFLTGLPLLGALAVLFAPVSDRTLRRLAVFFSLAVLVPGLMLFFGFASDQSGFQAVFAAPWFALPGQTGTVWFSLGADGISLLFVLLTAVLTPLVLVAAPGHIHTRVREFLFWMLLMETGMLGTFLATDLVLFYVFWEMSLVPLYFVVGIWGGENRIYATVKFFLYTLVGSLVMLIGLIRVALEMGTTNVAALVRADLPADLQSFAFACFALGFLIKVPVVPFHTWLPDAHVQAPTSGSVILAGVMLKLGTYGLLRYGVQMFPAAAVEWGPLLAAVGVVGIVYGSFLAWAQRDLKKLVAYSSVAHLGFVVLGTFAFTATAFQGAVIQGVNHGITTGALFLLVGVLYDRLHTRDLNRFGGLARSFPAFGFLLLFTTLASIGLPGTNGFVGEFLILFGSFATRPVLTSIGALGVVLGAVYMLGMCREVLFGPIQRKENRALAALKPREWAALAPLAALMLWIGIFPGPLLERTHLACQELARRVEPYTKEARLDLPDLVPAPPRNVEER